MAKSTKHTIVIIGCGNLAWHLAKELKLQKQQVIVYNHRKSAQLSEFKTKLNCAISVGLDKIDPSADFYFVCVSDRHISSVCKKIRISNKKALLIHCSGSLPLEDLRNSHPNKAVFYPIQSFSKKDQVEWTKIPVLLNASNKSSSIQLKNFVKRFTPLSVASNDKERLKIHLAAVVVNNFTNALYVLAQNIIVGNKQSNEFKLLLPLIEHTVIKLKNLSPIDAQTGPAMRGDQKVIDKHLGLLKNNKEIKKLYRRLSELIISQQKLKHA